MIPFGKTVKITLTNPESSGKFWFSCRGVENAPLVISGLTVPVTARLRLVHTQSTVRTGALVTFANVSGKGHSR